MTIRLLTPNEIRERAAEKFQKEKQEQQIKIETAKLRKQEESRKSNVKELVEKSFSRQYLKINLDQYMAGLHKWFYFTDDEIIEICLATLIGEKLPGDPLWLFLIAPPGALKTETLRAFSLSSDFYPLSDLTSKTFITGLMVGKDSNRKKVKDLLPELDKKVLIFKDFTTILEKNSDERSEIFAQLRECYDGTFSKRVGTLDQTIRYQSRFGLLAGVTPIVDNYWKLFQQLGERFLKVRWNEDLDLTTRKARQNEGQEEQIRAEIEKLAMGYLSNLDFSRIPSFDDSLYGPILDSISKFVAIGRTPISIKDSRTDFYFDFIPTPERPTRLVKQLKKMSRCLALIRGKMIVGPAEIETIRRIARDTIPQDRLAILQAIAENSKTNLNGCPKGILLSSIKMPETSILRVIEQLRLLDLIKIKSIREDVGFHAQEIRHFYQVSDFVNTMLYPPTLTEATGKPGG